MSASETLTRPGQAGGTVTAARTTTCRCLGFCCLRIPTEAQTVPLPQSGFCPANIFHDTAQQSDQKLAFGPARRDQGNFRSGLCGSCAEMLLCAVVKVPRL